VSLKEYHAKRHFSKTPEPEGSAGTDSGPLHFVVQKHQARNLHYDFRLELGGTLKSWAVPKGPSLDPKVKRLALMVEDHPLDYAGFEGIIPKGNYGAGTVMVWDEGTYHLPGLLGRNENERLAASGLEEGKLHLVLYGKKLRGEFILVKTQQGAENAWMFYKKQDAFATDQPLADDDCSVFTHRSMAEITSGQPARPSLPEGLAGVPQVPMPRNIKPMLASPITEAFDDPAWLFEIKWDGYRAIAEVDRQGVRLRSRSDLSLARQFPAVVEALQHLGHEAVLDGEIVVLDAEGKAQFQLLQAHQKSKKGVLAYYVFDLLYLDGHDLRNLPLLRRKELLASIIHGLPLVRLSDHVAGEGRAFFQAVAERRLEGIVAKLANSRYLPGQGGRTWLKIKTHLRQEAVIGGFTEERRNRKNLGALLLGVYQDNNLVYVGHVGSGFDRQTLADVRAKLEPLMEESCPFTSRPKANAVVHWVKPQLVCEISLTSWTDDGHLRHPVFVGLREDMPALNVHREEPKSMLPASNDEAPTVEGVSTEKVESTNSSRGGLRIDGHLVHVTHQSKVYWPNEGITKGMLIDYYREVASFILPYLKDRPESLHRQPGGIGQKDFFQKDVSRQPPPEWVQTISLPSEPGEEPTLAILCQNEATLVYLANLGCIELNPWHARVQSLDMADYMMIDLDPEAISFPSVVEVAQAIHKLLDGAEVPCYCKTSGKRGLHVFVPFAARYNHEQAKQFGSLIAQIIHRRLPAITSLVRDPRGRQARVYLDHLQNGKGKTLAVAYSVRPYPGATVSTPLKWSEVTRKLDPSKFTIRTTLQRLGRLGDLWAPVLGPGIDLHSCLERLASSLKTK
jgi:bifunctional non-homologous end joining protein LigD